MNYQDFIIEATDAELNAGTGRFKVRVLGSPAGEMKDEEAVASEYDDRQLQTTLHQLEVRNLDQAGMIAFGRQLATWLLPPQQAGAQTGVRELYAVSVARLGLDEGLCLQLRLPPQLVALPWEYLYLDAPGGGNGMDGFLGLNRKIALVRYEELNAPPPTVSIKGTIRVVAALASAAGLPALDLAREQADIEQALHEQQDLVNASYIEHATWDRVQAALAGGVDVLHFAGHGVFQEELGVTPGTYIGTGEIVLEDTSVKAEEVGITLHGSGVRLAVLGACESGRRDGINEWSGIAPALVKAQVPAVVAYQFPILDQCAIAFHQQFYLALVGGLSIETAVSVGRIAAYHADPQGRDWGAAVLYLRSSDALLFGGATDDAVRAEARRSVQTTWDSLLDISRRSTRRFSGTPERPGPFIPDVYVPWAEAEQTLHNFLISEALALVVAGDSGSGKTNLLCAWATNLQAKGNFVLFNNCATFQPDANVEGEVARAMGLDDVGDLPGLMAYIDKLAVANGKQCILIFDAVSEFRGSPDGREALLRAINAFVGLLPGETIRVVVCCRTSTWARLNFDTRRLFTNNTLVYAANGPGDDPALRPTPFNDGMLVQAYALYAQFFHLQTPLTQLSVALRERLCNPFMLRLLAQTYANKPVIVNNLALGLYKEFYEDRITGPGGLQDQRFVETLVSEMYRQQRSVFAITDLIQNPAPGLAADITSTSQDSSYSRLLDNGILMEVVGSGFFAETMVKFTSDQLGGYILARYLWRQPGTNAAQLIPDLLKNVQQFSLAWYAALMLLIPQRTPTLFIALAQSLDLTVRELVIEGLREIYADQPAATQPIIKQLVQTADQEVQRIGLQAAYTVNPRASDVFLWAALQDNPTLVQLTRDVLYLVWRSDPAYVYGLLRTLTANITLINWQTVLPTARFVLDLLVTIYINHCEQAYVIDQTSEIFHELTTNKLHLDVVGNILGALGPNVEQFLLQWCSATFAQPILDSIMATSLSPADQLFNLAPEQRVSLKQIAPFLDPQSDISNARAQLEQMLSSGVTSFMLAAAMVLSVHAYANFSATRQLMQDLFEGQQGQGRLWITLSLALLLPDTPDWTDLAVTCTQRLLTENAQIFYGDEPGILNLCDVVLLPPGLAYGKRGDTMPYIETLLRDGLQRGDLRLVKRCIAGLATVGFYYPRAVFATLGAVIPDMNAVSDELKPALIKTLSVIRTLYFYDVDMFLYQIGADEDMQRAVAAASSVELVSQTIRLPGYYNNAVHASIFYPKMRRHLTSGALNILAEAATPQEFISRYAAEAIQMAKDADYTLKNWTLPD